MVRQRKKRNERDSSPPSMELTERDTRIIEAVYQYRVLRQDQIHALFFGASHTTSQRRLALLYHHGFLERRFLTVRASYLLSPTLYLLDKRGATHLRISLGYDDISWKPTDVHVGQLFLEHTLAINDVRVAITLACRTSGYELLAWEGESDLKVDFDRVMLRERTGQRRAVSLIPDSYFAIATPRGKAHFFLELDRGTMTTKRFQDKVTAYLAYYQSGAYEQRYRTKSLRVLTVTESKKRLDNLRQTTQAAGAGSRFWFGLLSDLDAETLLNAPVWWVTGRDQQAALVDLP